VSKPAELCFPTTSTQRLQSQQQAFSPEHHVASPNAPVLTHKHMFMAVLDTIMEMAVTVWANLPFE
jgi:hypothetical protein